MHSSLRKIFRPPTPAGQKAFARQLVMGALVGAPLIALLLRWYSGHWHKAPVWIGAAGLIIGALSWIAPRPALPFYYLLHGVGALIGHVLTLLVLTIIFYLVVTPIALLLRALGKDPLSRRIDPSAKSYWSDAEQGVAPGDYFRQF